MSNNVPNEKLVADFCNSEFAPHSRGFLIPYAAQVVYIARMAKSTRLTAAFLSKKFGRDFSRRPIEDILAKVKNKTIVVTAKQLAQVAAEHPAATFFAEVYPEILNPNSLMQTVDAATAAKKISAKQKADEKTVAKKAAERVKKSADSKSATSGGNPISVKTENPVSATSAQDEWPAPDSPTSNELLEDVDAELREAGIPID